MVVGAIHEAWLVVAAALLVFLLLVVLRFALTMVGQTKRLASTVRDASERLQDALAEVRAESEIASERAELLGDLRGARTGRKGASRHPR